jgi:hypothetical protein
LPVYSEFFLKANSPLNSPLKGEDFFRQQPHSMPIDPKSPHLNKSAAAAGKAPAVAAGRVPIAIPAKEIKILCCCG